MNFPTQASEAPGPLALSVQVPYAVQSRALTHSLGDKPSNQKKKNSHISAENVHG
jgi:hypothetical protein